MGPPSSRTSKELESMDSTFTRLVISHGSARPPAHTTSQTAKESVNSRTTPTLEPHGERKPPTTHGTQSSSSTTNTASSVAPLLSTPSTEPESAADASSQVAPHALTELADSHPLKKRKYGSQEAAATTEMPYNSRIRNEG